MYSKVCMRAVRGGNGDGPGGVREGLPTEIPAPPALGPHFLAVFLLNTSKECFSNSRSIQASWEPIQKG